MNNRMIEWISVDKEPIPDTQQVLLSDGDIVNFGYFYDTSYNVLERFYDKNLEHHWINPCCVSHWAYLPDPPRKKNNFTVCIPDEGFNIHKHSFDFDEVGDLFNFPVVASFIAEGFIQFFMSGSFLMARYQNDMILHVGSIRYPEYMDLPKISEILS